MGALGALSLPYSAQAGLRTALKGALAVEFGPRRAVAHRLLARRFFASSGEGAIADREYGEIWRDAAAETGAQVTDHGNGFLEIARDGRSTWVWRQYVTLDNLLAQRRSLDKEMVHRLLAGAHLPIPQHASFSTADLRPALAFLRSATGPCVVKPAAGTGGGAGVSGGVRTPPELLVASAVAGRHGARLLIERQADGAMYRLLFLDGRLLDVVRRSLPHVVGDGRSSVRELIAAENRRRLSANGHRGFALLRVDLDCLMTLRRGGRTLRSVPADGEAVVVKSSSSENRREDNETVIAPLDEGLVARAREAAQVCGLRLAGVDIVTADPTAGDGRPGEVIIEVNCNPGLAYHYHVRDQQRATRVAIPLLRHLLAERSPEAPAAVSAPPAA